MTPLVGHAAKPPNGPTDRGAEAEVLRLSRQLSELTTQLRCCLDVTASQTSAAEVWRR